MNRRGQALIEFVLIVPILILILFVIVDFGNIFYSKYELENQSIDIVRMIRNGSNKEEILDIYSKLELDISDYKGDYKKIVLTKEINLFTPGLDRILGDPYLTKVERVIVNDEA